MSSHTLHPVNIARRFVKSFQDSKTNGDGGITEKKKNGDSCTLIFGGVQSRREAMMRAATLAMSPSVLGNVGSIPISTANIKKSYHLLIRMLGAAFEKELSNFGLAGFNFHATFQILNWIDTPLEILEKFDEQSMSLEEVARGEHLLPPGHFFYNLPALSWEDYNKIAENNCISGHVFNCPFCYLAMIQGLEGELEKSLKVASTFPAYASCTQEEVKALDKFQLLKAIKIGVENSKREIKNENNQKNEEFLLTVEDELLKEAIGYINGKSINQIRSSLIEELQNQIGIFNSEFNSKYKEQHSDRLAKLGSESVRIQNLLERVRSIAIKQDINYVDRFVRNYKEQVEKEFSEDCLPKVRGKFVVLMEPSEEDILNDLPLLKNHLSKRNHDLVLDFQTCAEKDLFNQAVKIAIDHAVSEPNQPLGIVIGNVDRRDKGVPEKLYWLDLVSEELGLHYGVLVRFICSFSKEKKPTTRKIPSYSDWFLAWARNSHNGLVMTKPEHEVPYLLQKKIEDLLK